MIKSAESPIKKQPLRISIFDLFKIGVGPSSSHTLGPWRCVLDFLERSKKIRSLDQVKSVTCTLFGSLAFTGKGHQTDKALILGLLGHDPETLDTKNIHHILEKVSETQTLLLDGVHKVFFDPTMHIVFDLVTQTGGHPNTLEMTFTYQGGISYEERYYSTGGGFFELAGEGQDASFSKPCPPYPAQTEKELLDWCSKEKKSVAILVYENECFWTSAEAVELRIKQLWETTKSCIRQAFNQQGVLPGGLGVKYRSRDIVRTLCDYDQFKDKDLEDLLQFIQQKSWKYNEVSLWTSAFALAVNESNASMGRIVTSPTNGAAGVLPAVLLHAICFEHKTGFENIRDFFCVAGEIGTLYVKEATISAAMGGCQAEIGVSSSMAAGALTQLLGGTPEQVTMAAEIAMEHHLGLTCDPVGGLVQVPCIERNTMGAAKAITATQLALSSMPSTARVSLDEVIDTMWKTAQDMDKKYKETSQGGLAISVSQKEC